MRQIWIPRAGGPEVLEVREAPDPEPEDGHFRIRVEATGINFADIMARMGLYPDAPPLPTVMGYEVAGVVDGAGSGANGFKDGDRVIAFTRFGGYSDVVTVPTKQVWALPSNATFEQGAAVPVNYGTAWIMLMYLGNLREGDRVLIHGAGGGVGQAAVQICKWRGAEIFGTASKGKHERLKEMGVHHCIDYRNDDFLEAVKRLTDDRGVDIALDPIGGESFWKSYQALRPLGRMYMFGASSMATGTKRSVVAALRTLWAMPSFKPVHMMNSNRGVQGVNLGHLWEDLDRLSAMLDEIQQLIGVGVLAPVVDKSFGFDEAAQAHTYIQDRKNFGKVVLVP